MSKMKYPRGRFNRFMSSKGFYAAIAVCLVGAGAATWLAVDRTVSGIEDANSRLIQSESSFMDFPLLEEVEKKQPDIPKVSASSSSSSMPSPSSEQQPEPEEPSVQAEAPPPSQSLVYALPLKGDIINQYSNGELVKNITLNDWRTHDGVDIAAEKGIEVYATADGVVSEIKKDSLWGTVLVISHIDGTHSIYSGLSEIVPVSIGENVLSKQVVGKIEGVPCEMSDECHLHFAMKKDGVWLDPLAVISKG